MKLLFKNGIVDCDEGKSSYSSIFSLLAYFLASYNNRCVQRRKMCFVKSMSIIISSVMVLVSGVVSGVVSVLVVSVSGDSIIRVSNKSGNLSTYSSKYSPAKSSIGRPEILILVSSGLLDLI